MGKTTIEWCTDVWNPVSGCSKVSQGCKNCYAERVFPRAYSRQQWFVPKKVSSVAFDGISPAATVTVHAPRQRVFTDVQTHPDRLDQPLRWRRPRRVFVDSMSDLFHEDVPFEFIAKVFAVMACTTRHTYQVLTKRPERMVEFFQWLRDETDPDISAWGVHRHGYKPSNFWPRQIDPTAVWPQWTPCRNGRGGYDNCGPAWPLENVWLGVSAEDQRTFYDRVSVLASCPAAVRFVSFEPLLGAIDARDFLHVIPVLRSTAYASGGEITGISAPTMHWEQSYNVHTREPIRSEIDWAIVGGESGPGARPMNPDWVRSLRDQCQAAGVPYFFKQWGEWAPSCNHGFADPGVAGKRQIVMPPYVMYRVGKKTAGNVLDGRTHLEFPT